MIVMRERIAKVIRDGIAMAKSAEEMSRAVLEAMREPTMAMCEAGNKADCYSGECGAHVVWPAMIDEALK